MSKAKGMGIKMNEINDLKLYFEQNFGKFSELENIRKKYLPKKRLLTIICIFFGFILAGTLFASVSKGKDMLFNILYSFIPSVFLSFFLYAILLNVWCFIISYKVNKYLVSNLTHNIIGIINPRMKYALRSPFSLKDIKNSGLFGYLVTPLMSLKNTLAILCIKTYKFLRHLFFTQNF